MTSEHDSIDVLRIAKLARVAIAADPAKLLAADMARIVTQFEHLRDAEIEPVAATSAPIAIDALRSDVVVENPSRDAIKGNAIALENGCFVVPRVIE